MHVHRAYPKQTYPHMQYMQGSLLGLVGTPCIVPPLPSSVLELLCMIENWDQGQ